MPISSSWHVYLNKKEISKTRVDTIVEIKKSKLNADDTLTLSYQDCSPLFIDTYSRLVLNYDSKIELILAENKSFISYDAKVSGIELLEYLNSNSQKPIELFLQTRIGNQSSKWSRPTFVMKLQFKN